jgi:hypothetical protein
MPHTGILPHVLTVRLHTGPGGFLAEDAVSAKEAGRHHSTGRQSFHIPLPGARLRFVKVVDAEYEVAFGGSEDSEIGHMHIATGLHRKTGDGRRGKIMRHHRRRAA